MMNTLNKSIAALTMLAFTIIFCLGAEAKIKVWKLSQADEILGERIVWGYKDGYRVDYPKSKYTYILSAPDWQLYAYNTTYKNIYTTDPKNWEKQFSARGKLLISRQFPVKSKVLPVKKMTMLGLKVQRIDYVSTVPVKGSDIASSSFYVLEDMPIAKQVTETFAHMWNKDLCQRQSFQIDVISGRGNKKKMVSTSAVAQVDVPDNFFKPPQGYKKAASESEVTLGSDLINDIVGDLGKIPGKD